MKFTVEIHLPDTMTPEELDQLGVLCIVANVRDAVRLVEVAAPRTRAFTTAHLEKVEKIMALDGMMKPDPAQQHDFLELHNAADQADHDAHFITKALSEAGFHLLHAPELDDAEKDARNRAAFEEWKAEMQRQLAKAKGNA